MLAVRYDPYMGVVRLQRVNPCSSVLLEKLTGFQLIKKFPAFYGTRMLVTAFTSSI